MDNELHEYAELRPRPRQHFRFIMEALLTIVVAEVLWMAFLGPSAFYVVFHFGLGSTLGFRLTVSAGVAFIFFLLAYYGTSYEVTPFDLILEPVRLMTRALVLRARQKPFTVGSSAKADKTSDGNILIELDSQRSDQPTPEIGDADETAGRVLRRSAHSAWDRARKMERRLNTHLILGVLVGFVGLVVWYYSFFISPSSLNKTRDYAESTSVPQSSPTERAPEPSHPTAPPAKISAGAALVWDLIPRVTILVFIELLAGFFLRQYRIGVEDFKYFLELQRRADASRVAYSIFDQLGDDESKRKFAATLLEAPSDIRLQKDETTTILEAIKSEENPTLKLISLLGDHLESVTKLLRKDKEK